MPKVIRVKFANGDSHMPIDGEESRLYHREYDYFLVGDNVQVPRRGFAVVEVSGILKIVRIVGSSSISSKATKYAITVFSLEQHKAAVERQRAIEEAKQAIAARAQEALERQKYTQLAESDPQLKGLLEHLAQLEAGTAEIPDNS